MVNKIDLSSYKVEPRVLALLSPVIARNHCVLPLRVEGNELFIAMADPTNAQIAGGPPMIIVTRGVE